MPGYPEFFLNNEVFDGSYWGIFGGTDYQSFFGIYVESNGARASTLRERVGDFLLAKIDESFAAYSRTATF